MTIPGLRRPLTLQLLWCVGAAAWNVEGVQRLAAGKQALGPTASLAGAGIICLVAIALIIGANRARWLYIVASLVIIASSGFAVWGAIVGDPSDWPSQGWRIGGAALNLMGLMASLVGLMRIAGPETPAEI